MTGPDSASGNPRKRVSVTHGRHGWIVMVMKGDEVVRRVNYTDWHRVERAIVRFDAAHERREKTEQ